MRRALFFVLVILFVSLLAGCPMQQAKSVQDMTPKERVTWMLGVYNSQYSDYMTVTGHTRGADGGWTKTSAPQLSDGQREVLRQKKQALQKVYPLIKAYDGYVSSGVTPSRAMEDEIVGILNSLTGQ